MNPTTIPQSLHPLATYLDGLTERASIGRLRELLTESQATLADIAPYAQFSELGYTRNLVCEGPWYHLLVLCWRSGHRSPIHNHAQSSCGLKILTGIATETIFQNTPCGQVKAVGSTDMTAGLVCATQDADIHQVSNLQPPGQDLVTLHIYSPPLLAMDKFSITGQSVERYVPMMGHADGSGI